MATIKKTAPEVGQPVTTNPALLVKHIRRVLRKARTMQTPAGVSNESMITLVATLSVLRQDAMRKRDGNTCRPAWLERIRLARALAITVAGRILHLPGTIAPEALQIANWCLVTAELLENSITELNERFGKTDINTGNFASLLVSHSPHLYEVTKVQAEQIARELAAHGLLTSA
jgi:hypothetical protein